MRYLWLTAALGLLLCTSESSAQISEFISVTNEFGEQVRLQFPPEDGSYVKGELIVKFREGALNYERLCYDEFLDDGSRMNILEEEFPIEELILDQGLMELLQLYGAMSLKRMTAANPCADTLTVTRNGEKLRLDDHNYMLLRFNADGSDEKAIYDIALELTMFYQGAIELVEPNYYLDTKAWDPNDQAWQYPGHHPSYLWNLRNIGMYDVWEHTKGRYDVKVGVVDNGMNFNHIDLGAGIGPGNKVTGGWSWTYNSPDFSTASSHGTAVSGIIGALSNNDWDIPGVAGGDAANGNMGVQLAGFQVSDPQNPWSGQLILSDAIAAIREASACNPSTGYGYCCNFINASWASYQYSEMLRSALADAFERGVPIVAARGNNGAPGSPSNLERYPASYDESWVITVGAADERQEWVHYSNLGFGVDLLAPGGDRYRQFVTSLDMAGSHSNSFEGTSFATPHVTGTAALLLSYAIDHGGIGSMPVYEDYQGMLKASAMDINPSNGISAAYMVGYDSFSGWGHLQSDRIFRMIEDNPNRIQAKYTLTHVSTAPNFIYGPWSNSYQMYFANSYGSSSQLQQPGNHAKNKYLPAGVYLVRKREVSGIYDLATLETLDLSAPVYVWGISSATGGYSAASPNYQINWTTVTSGEGNNSGDITQPGILHSHSQYVELKTYQYEVHNPVTMAPYGLIPPVSDLAFNFTVFARSGAPVNIEQLPAAANDFSIAAYPNPSSGRVDLSYRTPGNNNATSVSVYDLYGRRLITKKLSSFSQNPVHYTALDLTSLPNGMYKLIMSYGSERRSTNIVISH
jgi:subtilase family protein/type IX secretion system substrate protein